MSEHKGTTMAANSSVDIEALPNATNGTGAGGTSGSNNGSRDGNICIFDGVVTAC
jgi:hypothetical protein